jgi:hypothetical protein
MHPSEGHSGGDTGECAILQVNGAIPIVRLRAHRQDVRECMRLSQTGAAAHTQIIVPRNCGCRNATYMNGVPYTAAYSAMTEVRAAPDAAAVNLCREWTRCILREGPCSQGACTLALEPAPIS